MSSVYTARKRISERESRNLIVAMAIHGNHFNDPMRALKTTASIKEHLSQAGLSFKSCIRQCRDFSRSVPVYENLVGPTWTTTGVTVSRTNHISGEYEPLISGDGTYNESDYWAAFEIAIEDFEQSLRTGKHERFLAAVNAGIAAIETYLNRQYMIRLKRDKSDTNLREKFFWRSLRDGVQGSEH